MTEMQVRTGNREGWVQQKRRRLLRTAAGGAFVTLRFGAAHTTVNAKKGAAGQDFAGEWRPWGLGDWAAGAAGLLGDAALGCCARPQWLR